MQIYTSRKGEKQGPFTVYRIKEMIDADELSVDDLGWHEGLDQWCALKEIPVITSTLRSLEKKGRTARPYPAIPRKTREMPILRFHFHPAPRGAPGRKDRPPSQSGYKTSGHSCASGPGFSITPY